LRDGCALRGDLTLRGNLALRGDLTALRQRLLAALCGLSL
jgi:hypothetical protein